MKFFNTYLRSAINAHDIRTAYNVLNQYRLVGESAVKRDPSGARAVEIAKYFKYYGLLSFNAKLPFILETVAYDLCALIEFAFDQKSPATQPLLGSSCRSTRKARATPRRPACAACARRSSSWPATSCCAATRALAREVYLDMGDERPERLASIRDELLNVESREFWEVSDRGVNFDYLARRAQERSCCAFFEWFGDTLPPPRISMEINTSKIPVPADAGSHRPLSHPPR